MVRRIGFVPTSRGGNGTTRSLGTSVGRHFNGDVCRLQIRDTGLRTTLPIVWSRCGSGRQQSASNAPTDKELSRARWCHLLALPGMLVLAVLVDVASDRVGYLSLVPLNLLIPFVYWLPQLKSRFCAESWQGSVELSVVVDSSNVRNLVRSTSTGGIRVVAYVFHGVAGRHGCGLHCLERCGERGRRQVSY